MIKTLWPIFASLVLTLALLLFTRSYLFYVGVENDLSAWGVFFTVYGVLYAIMVGFLLIGVLDRFNAISRDIEEELNALQDIRDFTIYLNGQTEAVRNIKRALLKYVDSVLNREWEEMGDLSKPTDADTSPELYEIIRAVHQVKVTNDSDGVALGALIGKISEITTLRTKRIALANEQLPPRLHLLVVLMSLVLIAGFILMAVTSFWIHLLMVLSVMASIHLVYMVLSDLNHPFSGLWNINKGSFEKLKGKLESSL